MENEDYFKRLRAAKLEELKTILAEDLACPINWQAEDVGSSEQIFLEKWFYTVAEYLPNGESDAFLLECNGSFIPAPDDESFSHPLFDADRARDLAFNTFRARDSYRKAYRAATGKFVGLYAQGPDERDKHFVSPNATLKDIVDESSRDKKVGFLLPNFHPRAQRKFLWESIANAFEDIEITCRDDNDLDDQEAFDVAWNALFSPDHLRLCVDTMTTVGYSGGKEARWLVYDISYHGKVCHCFPVLEALPSLRETALDNLQGLKEAFLQKRSDWP